MTTRTFDQGQGTIKGPFTVTIADDGTKTLTLVTGKQMPIDTHAFERILRYAEERVSAPPAPLTRPAGITCRYCGEPIDLFTDSAHYCCRECRDCALYEGVREEQT